MRTLTIVAVGIGVLCLAAAALHFGCANYCMEAQGMREMGSPVAAVPKAHGGTDNVNDAAFDAMFFRHYGVNPFIDTDDEPLSTFAVDVDTGSYTLCRSYMERGYVPPKDAVRVEEFVNYFDYGYSPPEAGSPDAFAVHLEAAPSRFSPGRLLLRVGLKAREVAAAARKPAILTFIIDVSGSMQREDRLELVKKSLGLLVDQLREGDRVGIAVYGSTGHRLLDHRGIERKKEILAAVKRLSPEGSTNAEEGLAIGYGMAAEAFVKGAINRVILCSDGVANVGRTGPESILREIDEHARSGITLTAVGFGMGNYNDVLMEQLADKGHGHYAYVDTLAEARRVFVANLTGTLQVVARDAKVQVALNPQTVRSYRLLGYENRALQNKDFRNDKVDGGQVGAGHSVTALYELKLWPDKAGPLATVRVRYKEAEGVEVHEQEKSVARGDGRADFDAASGSFRLTATVAEFAEVLRKSYWARGHGLDAVLEAARKCPADGRNGEAVAELVRLIEKAAVLKAGSGNDAGSSLEE
jgi:Ca-activated chloride channel family protein